jgi:hypothetical protein
VSKTSKPKPEGKRFIAEAREQNTAGATELEALVRRAVHEELARGLVPHYLRNRSVEPDAGVDTDGVGMFGFQPSTGPLCSKTKNFTTDSQTFLTSAQIASRWGMHEESIRRMLRRRVMGSVLLGRRRLVPISEVELLERQGTVPRL